MLSSKANSLKNRAINKLIRHYTNLNIFFFDLKCYGYKLAKINNRINLFLLRNDWSKSKTLIEIKYNLPEIKCDAGYLRLLQSMNCNDFDKFEYENIEQNIRQCNLCLKSLSTNILLHLYQYYRYFGDFRVANYLREYMLLGFISEQSSLRTVSPLALQAYLELDKPEYISTIIEEKKIKYFDRIIVNEILSVSYLMMGDNEKANLLWKNKFTSSDNMFFDQISGKSVAVVGPGKNDKVQGDDIDSYDFIIRTNYRIGSNYPESKYGNRTDISYYNHARISSDFEEVRNATKKLSWVVLKSQCDEGKYNRFVDNNIFTRTSYTAHQFFFHDAAPMGIQNIISDLMRFSPKVIKIYNSNFYNTANTYSENYRKIPLNADFISESLRIHEPFSGFRFIQNMVNRGLCKVDTMTNDAVKISVDKYAENINQYYGSTTL
jgi:hypothetical protein